jgi:energy-coupling factor transporter transmembrane protein EcfT
MHLDIPDKLSLVLLAWTCAFLLPWHYGLLCILALIALKVAVPSLRPINATSEKYLKRFSIYSFLLVGVLVTANGLLVHDGPVRVHVGFVNLYDAGLQYGMIVSVRLVLLSLSVLLFFVSTRFQDIAGYLEMIGLPKSLVTILLLTLFFLEQLPKNISQVFTAQEARGAPVRAGVLARSRSFFLVLSPLLLSSIIESTERGLALELRGYHSRKAQPISVGNAPGGGLWRYVFTGLTLTLIAATILRWLTRS